ncbi:MAG: LptA/OstA family protein [Elusimicrobiota bacterium]
MNKNNIIFISIAYISGFPYSLFSGPAPSEFLKADSLEFRMKENKMIYRKNVSAVVGKNFLTADYAVDDKSSKIMEMSGNINGYYIDETTGVLKIKADNGTYNSKTDQSKLWGNCWAIYTSSDGRIIEIKADLIDFNGITKEAKFYDNVSLAFEKNTAQSQFAQYFHDSKKIVMLKEKDFMPVVNYFGEYEAKFTAEKIMMMPEERKLYFENNVFSQITRKAGI